MKKFINNKIIVAFLVMALVLPFVTFSFTGCEERVEVLKIFNSGEYIADGSEGSEDVVASFESWYKEKTGKNIRVEYSVFDTNETMYTQVNNKHADYDLVCPSDYMVQKMLNNDLLLPIGGEDFDEIWADAFSDEDPLDYGLDEDDEITVDAIMNENLMPLLTAYDPGWETGEFYSVPYMWGTFGILYDIEKIKAIGGEDAEEDMQSWEAIFGDKYKGHIYMKNSVRDAYAVANIYNSSNELARLSENFTNFGDAYHEKLSDCMNYPNENTIDAAEKTLKAQKKNLFAYESDEGKEDLLTGKSDAALSFVWSCDAGYVIGMEENLNLRYSVPKEGTNVWVDNWCIPKYAGNVTAAKYFIAFCNLYNTAYENMWFVGTTVPVRAVAEDISIEIVDPWSAVGEGEELEDYLCFAELFEEYADECDEDETCECEWHKYARMYSECLFPSDETLERAAVMTDFDKYNTDIVRMFIRVKAS